MKRDSDEQPAKVLARTDQRDDYSSSVTGIRMRELQMTEVVLIRSRQQGLEEKECSPANRGYKRHQSVHLLHYAHQFANEQ